MQIVYVFDSRDPQYLRLYLLVVDAFRRGLHQHIDCASDDGERLSADPERDQDRDDGVRVVPIPQVDDKPAGYDAQAGEGVSHQVEKGAPQIEVVPMRAQ